MKYNLQCLQKGILFIFFSLIFFTGWSQPLTGIKAIPGDYSSISAAVSALNVNGVGTGGVIINVAAGYTETLTAGIVMTATGTAANPIIFQRSGTGANPTITAFTGTKLSTSADSIDVMWAFSGSDFVTINGINLAEATGNTNPTTMMEVGYGFYKVNGDNGCNNNTVQNCTITLNRDNVTTAPAGPRQNASGSIGIEFVNANRTTVNTGITVTSVSGASSTNRIYSNTIQNCNFGILLSGFAAPSPYSLADLNNEIGGVSPSTGNTIINFGGGTGAGSACGAMLITNQWSFNILNNLINNNTGTGINHNGSNRGIWLFNSSAGASCNVKRNTITITSGTNTTAINWCLNVEMATTGANGNTINLDSNQFLNCVNTSASTAAFTAIWLNTAATNVNVRGNYIYGFRYSGTGTTQCILNQLACGNLNISNNIIDSVILDGVNGTGIHHNIGVTTAPTISLNVNDNIITRTTLNTTGTGTKTIHGINYTGSTPVNNFTGNTVNNITRNGITGGTTIGIFQGGGTNGTSTTTIRRNTISNLSITGTGTTSTMYGIQASTGTIVVDSNTIFNLSCQKTTGTGVLYGIYNIGSPNNESYNNNLINNINHSGTGITYGIYSISGAGTKQILRNTLHNISTTGSTVAAINTTISTHNVAQNRIYNVFSTGTSAIVSGIIMGTVSSGTAFITNNLIADLRAPNTTTATPTTAPSIRGINITSTSSLVNISVSYNTVHLNATSTGSAFGTAALFHTVNATATTANLILRNNILVNNSTAVGTGRTVAYHRSGTALNNYDNSSNNNLFYAGTPSATNLIFYDGTNADQTLAAYKTRVLPRDSASQTENISFVSILGSSTSFLKINPTIPTFAESGGILIPGIGADIAGTVRAGFTGYSGTGGLPDLGAWEEDLLSQPINQMVFDSTTATQLPGIVPIGSVNNVVMRIPVYTTKGGNALSATSFKFNTSGTSTNADITQARLFFTGPDSVFNTNTFFGSVNTPSGTFYINGSRILNTGINYFWLTYSISGTALPNNIVDAVYDSITVSGIQYAPVVSSPAASLTIQAPLSGVYNVGSGQTFPTLTQAISTLRQLGVSGPVTFVLQDLSYDTLTGEIFPIVLNSYANASTTNTVTIRPATGISASISGNSGVATFDINNGSHYIIDGRQGGTGGFTSGNNLIIRNTNLLAPTIRFINDADSNTIFYADVRGGNTTALGSAGAGVINFGTTTFPNGNDFNTIKFCDIREDGANLPVSSISSIGSATTVIANNDNNIIDSCNIYNFFSPTVASAAIYVGANNSEWKIRGNKFFQTAPRAFTAGPVHRVLWITPNVANLTSASGFVINNNFVGGNNVSGTGNYEMNGAFTHTFNAYDISVGLGAPTSVQGNTITNINYTSASTSSIAFLGINVVNGNVDVGTITGNIIGSRTTNGSITVNLSSTTTGGAMGIRTGGGTGNTYNIANNIISGYDLFGTTTTTTPEFFGINVFTGTNINVFNNLIGDTASLTGSIRVYSSATSGTLQQRVSGIFNNPSAGTPVHSIFNNTIANIFNFHSVAGTHVTATRGILVNPTVTGTFTVTNNTIRNLYSAALSTATGLNTAIGGLVVSGTVGTFDVRQNTISGLHLTTTNTAVAVQNTGIFYSTPAALGNNLLRNSIHTQLVWANNPLAVITGIDIAAGTTNVNNNMIRMGIDTSGNSITTGCVFRGITKNSGNSNIYFNTVYIGGNNVITSTSNSFAFERSGTGTDDIQNNIFSNVRTNASPGSAGHFALQINNNTTLNSNYNLLYADSIGRVGTTVFANISAWRGGAAEDANSIYGNPGLLNPNGDINSVNLRINTTTPTALEATGIAVTGIGTDVDFDGQTRSSLTPIDMGADAGNFIPLDLAPPAITYTVASNTQLTTNRTITATITDATGIYMTGTLVPRIYFKKFAAGTVQSTAGVLNSGTATNSNWTFTINNSLMGGVTGDDSVYYFIVAQDSTFAGNMGSNPGGVVGIDVNTITVLPNFNSYKIISVISGTFSVGTGQTFTTLTGNGGIFSYINSSIVGGNITIQITSDIEETGLVGLNETIETGAGGYTISIEPSAAVVRNITGSVAATGLIRLSGADRVRIDGSFSGLGRYLRFMNRTLNGSTLNLLEDADNDTIANCIIEGVNNTVGMLNFQSSTKPGGTGNDSNAVIGCLFRDTIGNITPTGMPNTCMFSQGVLSNDFNTFDNNELVNFGFNGVNLSTTAGDFWRITNNKVYQVLTRNAAMVVLQIDGGSGHSINNNSIGGAASDRSGPAFQTSSSLVAISLATTVTNTFPITINNNIISNMAISGTGASAFFGIRVANGNLTIAGNTIGGNMMPYDTIKNNFDNGAITINGGSSVIVENNLISNMAYYRASGDRNAGITITSTAPNPLSIRNNTIHTITGNNTGITTSSFRVGAIVVTSAPTNITITGNTIRNIQNINTGTAAYVVSGIMYNGGASTNPIITQNRIRNIGAVGTGTGTSAPEVMGIHLISATNAIVANNQISLGDSALNQSRVYGIFDGTTGTNTYAYNSFFINGQTAAGANHSTAFHRSSSATINFRNNLVYNIRTTSGTGFNFGVSSTSNVGVSGANINYNMFFVNDTARLAELPAGISNSWNALNTFYPGTYNTNWAELTTAVAPGSLFTDVTNGNLGIVNTSANAWYVNGKGIRITNISGDFNNASGVRSTSILSGATDIGSVEFTPLSTPPAAFADKVPTANDSTQFFFASRMIAKAKWGNTGTLPSAVSAFYYSGANPSNTPTGSSFINGYYELQPTGGSGYTYDLTLMQDSANLRNISSVNNMQIARYSGPSTNWFRYTSSSVLGNTGFVAATGFTEGGIYTLTDLAVNPLPVSLTAFTARAFNADVILNWKTASEINNYGFFIERSLDGIHFSTINFVEGKGNSNVTAEYVYTDVNAFGTAAKLYYRLRQQDIDGTISYSNVAVLTRSDKSMQQVSMYPNPATATTTVEFFTVETNASIQVADINGKIVYTTRMNTVEGLNKFVLNEVNTLDAGIYLVTIHAGNESQVLKLMKH
ncbi:MAG: T9SS type A sorting domain-containing protein [Bacteroidota bacterium]